MYSSVKVKKVVQAHKPNKKVVQEPVNIFWNEKEEIEEKLTEYCQHHLFEVYGIREMAKSRHTRRDAKMAEMMVKNAIERFSTNYINDDNYKRIGCFHAHLRDVCVVKSTTEYKGMRVTLKVRLSHTDTDKGSDARIVYRDTHVFDSFSELVRGICEEMADLVYEEAKKEANEFNAKLEKGGQSGQIYTRTA